MRIMRMRAVARALRGFFRLLVTDIDAGNAVDESEHAVSERRSLVESLRRVTLLFAAAWQVVMLLTVLVALGPSGAPLAAGTASVGLLALLAFRVGWLGPVLPVAMVALGQWAYQSSHDIASAVVFAGTWQVNFSSFVAGLLILRSYAVFLVLATSVANATIVALTLPGWGVQFPISIVVTQFAIISALKWGIVRLVAVADAADAAAAAVSAAQKQARLDSAVSFQLAEESRVLHDTAVNTLGAIANGAAGTADREQVRAQCRRDISVLESLRAERMSLRHAELADIFRQPGLPTVREGDEDAVLAQSERLLSADVVGGIVNCVREAVTNATKHSGAAEVIVRAHAEGGSLTIEVIDHGVGFSQSTVQSGSGISASILSRARELGFAATVRSSPGAGTTVVLDASLSATSEATQELPPRREVGISLDTKASELWGLGVALVSVVLALAGSSNAHFALVPMVAVMLAAWMIYRRSSHGAARPAVLVLLALSTCLVFFLAAAATELGTSGAIHWHALAPTGPFVMLLAAARTGKARLASVAAWSATAAAIAAATAVTSRGAAVIVLLAALVGLGFSGVWATFQVVLHRLGQQSERMRLALQDARLRSELDAATQQNYRRWVTAGLDSSIQVLRQLAAGVADPRDQSVREECATEERYLRQILQISPHLVNLSRELPDALRTARTRSVSCILRLGEVDANDAETARSLTGFVSAALEGMQPGEVMHASVFPVSEGLQLTLLGPRIVLPADTVRAFRRGRLNDHDLVEVVYSNGIR